MPTYDYVCNACGKALEMFQKMSEHPKRKCPNCGKLKLVRLIGPGAGVIFKGSGFYSKDYGGKKRLRRIKVNNVPVSVPKTGSNS